MNLKTAYFVFKGGALALEGVERSVNKNTIKI